LDDLWAQAAELLDQDAEAEQLARREHVCPPRHAVETRALVAAHLGIFLSRDDIAAFPSGTQTSKLLVGCFDGVDISWLGRLDLQTLRALHRDGVEGAAHLARLSLRLDVFALDLVVGEE